MRLTTTQGQSSPVQMGTVQWFSNSKGYGFIRGQDGVERFFHVTDLAGGFIPDRGDSVVFQSRLDNKGPRATGIRQTEYQVSGNYRRQLKNGRIPCPHCSTPIVPRMVFWSGTPIYSMCQFCGGKIKDFRGPYTPWYKIPWIINSIFFLIAIKFSVLLIYKTGNLFVALYPFLAVGFLLFFRPVKLVRNALAVTVSAWKWIAGKSEGRQTPTPWRV
jgi:cold shock CspA family protein